MSDVPIRYAAGLTAFLRWLQLEVGMKLKCTRRCQRWQFHGTWWSRGFGRSRERRGAPDHVAVMRRPTAQFFAETHNTHK